MLFHRTTGLSVHKYFSSREMCSAGPFFSPLPVSFKAFLTPWNSRQAFKKSDHLNSEPRRKQLRKEQEYDSEKNQKKHTESGFLFEESGITSGVNNLQICRCATTLIDTRCVCVCVCERSVSSIYNTQHCRLKAPGVTSERSAYLSHSV